MSIEQNIHLSNIDMGSITQADTTFTSRLFLVMYPKEKKWSGSFKRLSENWNGNLARKGLVALPNKELDVVVSNVKNMIVLKPENIR